MTVNKSFTMYPEHALSVLRDRSNELDRLIKLSSDSSNYRELKAEKDVVLEKIEIVKSILYTYNVDWDC